MKTLALALVATLAAACSSGQTPTTTPDTESSAGPGGTATAAAGGTAPDASSATAGGGTTTPTSEPPPTASSVPSTEPAPTAMAPDAGRGEKLFTENNCNSCHGSKAKPGKKNVFAMKWSDDEKKKAADVIKKGKSPMPGFGDKLSDAQVADLVAYVSTK